MSYRMPKFKQVADGHVTTATDILWNLSLDVYAPLKSVVLCPICSGLDALLKTLEKRVLDDPEEIMEARSAAGTCIVMGFDEFAYNFCTKLEHMVKPEVLRQLGDMLANVNDLAIRQNRAKLLEVDICIGSLQTLAVTAQNKMNSLVNSLQLFHPDTSSLQSNWSEFSTWLCGVLLSLYCIQKPKIWNQLMLKKSDNLFIIDSFLMSPNNSKVQESTSIVEESQGNHSIGLKLVTTTLLEEMKVFSKHLSKVEKQLLDISTVLRESGVTHFPEPVPY